MWVESSLVAPPSFDLQIMVEKLKLLAGVCCTCVDHTHTHTLCVSTDNLIFMMFISVNRLWKSSALEQRQVTQHQDEQELRSSPSGVKHDVHEQSGHRRERVRVQTGHAEHVTGTGQRVDDGTRY